MHRSGDATRVTRRAHQIKPRTQLVEVLTHEAAKGVVGMDLFIVCYSHVVEGLTDPLQNLTLSHRNERCDET